MKCKRKKKGKIYQACINHINVHILCKKVLLYEILQNSSSLMDRKKKINKTKIWYIHFSSSINKTNFQALKVTDLNSWISYLFLTQLGESKI